MEGRCLTARVDVPLRFKANLLRSDALRRVAEDGASKRRFQTSSKGVSRHVGFGCLCPSHRVGNWMLNSSFGCSNDSRQDEVVGRASALAAPAG